MANPSPPSNTPLVVTQFQQPPTLAQIEQKIRRLTRSPSTAQLSPADLDNYINTFVVYDFPEHLRMFNLRTTFNFWCNPYQDIYISIHDPVYIAGYQSFYTQSPEQFYGIYPQTNNIQAIGPIGDGV